VGLGAVGPAGLRHVGPAAAALAAERLGTLAHQFDRIEARGEIACDADDDAGLAVLGDANDCDHAGSDLFFAVVDKALQILGLDAANAGGDRAFAGHRDEPDIAGAPHMRAAAQFHRPAERVGAVLTGAPAHRDDANLVAILFAEQRPRTGLARVVHPHQAGGDL